MQLKDHVKPITYVKAHAAELLEQVELTRQPIVVTQKGEARAVLVDVETYDSWRKALAMMKLIALSESSAAEKGWIPQDQVFADIERAIAEIEEHG